MPRKPKDVSAEVVAAFEEMAAIMRGELAPGRVHIPPAHPDPATIMAALAATDWELVDAMTDEDIAQQIADNPDAAPDLSDLPPGWVIRRRITPST